MSNDPSLIGEFLSEAKDLIASVEADLLRLEREGTPASDETLNRMFRAVHTVKGNAGFFGFKKTVSVAHSVEALLAIAREGRLKLGPPHINALLHGVDTLRVVLDTTEMGDQNDTAPVLAELRQLVDAADHQRPAPPAVEAPEQPSLEGEIWGPEGFTAWGGVWEPSAKASPPAPVEAATVAAPPPTPKRDATPPAPVEPASHPAEPRVTGEPARPGEEAVDPSQEAVRIRVDVLGRLMMLAGELVLVRNRLLQHTDRSDPVSNSISQRLDVVTSDLQETIMRTRMQPIGTIFGKFSRIVRDLGAQLRKKIVIDMTGNEVELDKTILETLTAPLVHVIRNCCDHGIEPPDLRVAEGKPETGRITLRAYHEGGQIVVVITDDGRGIDPVVIKATALARKLKTAEELARLSPKQILALVFLPGLSTVKEVSDISGRGVGMDVVQTSIERLGGSVVLESEVGRGTTLTLRLPLTLAIIPSLIVVSEGQRFAIPQVNLEELVRLYDEDVYSKIECAGARQVYRLRDVLLPIVWLSDVLRHKEPFDFETQARLTENARADRASRLAELQRARAADQPYDWSVAFAVVKVGNTRFGLVIDAIVGTEEIVVKPMHRCVKDLAIYSGVTVLGDGKVALILDPLAMARYAGIEADEQHPATDAARRDAEDATQRRSLLLFKSGAQEQFGVDIQAIKRIERVEAQQIQRVGGREFVTVDGASTAVVRLEHVLPVSPVVETSELFMLLPKTSRALYGVVASRLVDIGDYDVTLDHDAFRAEGVTATALIDKTMTLLVDLDVVGRSVEPFGSNP
ncbi:MAG: chemotaxis protein CheA [Polyangiales bacterium]